MALANATFASDATASSFALITDIPSISVLQVGVTGTNVATLTPALTGDFAAVETLAVRVPVAAHSGSDDIATGTVTPTPGIFCPPKNIAVREVSRIRNDHPPGFRTRHLGPQGVGFVRP